MRYVSAALCAFVIALSCAGSAHAETSTVFPPDNMDACADTGAKYLSWYHGATATHCSSGQEILTNAIPTCAAGQIVGFDGTKFICETVPTCTGNSFLQFDGMKFLCTPLPFPACSNGQSLTLVNGKLVCTTPGDSCVPNNTVTGTDACSATCGGGTQTVHWSDGCGHSSTTVQSCNTQACSCTPHNTITGYGACVSPCIGNLAPPHMRCDGVQDVYWSDGCGNTSTTQQSCTP